MHALQVAASLLARNCVFLGLDQCLPFLFRDYLVQQKTVLCIHVYSLWRSADSILGGACVVERLV